MKFSENIKRSSYSKVLWIKIWWMALVIHSHFSGWTKIGERNYITKYSNNIKQYSFINKNQEKS